MVLPFDARMQAAIHWAYWFSCSKHQRAETHIQVQSHPAGNRTGCGLGFHLYNTQNCHPLSKELNDVKCHMFSVTVNHLIQHPTRALESRVELLYAKGLENRNVSCDPFRAENFALKDEPRTPEHHGGQTGENPSYLTAFLDTYFHFHIMSDLCDRRKGGKRSWTDFPYYVYSGPCLVKILIPREESGPPMGSEPVSGGLYCSWMLVFIFFTSGSQQVWS